MDEISNSDSVHLLGDQWAAENGFSVANQQWAKDFSHQHPTVSKFFQYPLDGTIRALCPEDFIQLLKAPLGVAALGWEYEIS